MLELFLDQVQLLVFFTIHHLSLEIVSKILFGVLLLRAEMFVVVIQKMFPSFLIKNKTINDGKDINCED